MSVEDEAQKVLLDLGLWWPEADSGKLRSAATAWHTFAYAVDDVRGPVQQSASSIIHNNTGESIEAFDKFWGRYAQNANGKDSGWLRCHGRPTRTPRSYVSGTHGAASCRRRRPGGPPGSGTTRSGTAPAV